MVGELWRTTLLHRSATVQAAIECLDRSGLQIVMVVDHDERMLGTITDGDIRRGLLRGLELASPIDSIVHRDPLVIPPQLGRDNVPQLMQANRIHQLPVTDADRRVVGLQVWDLLQASEARPNTVVIMAGGKGMRLRPHTENCPKPLLPVGGKPILEHIIERARDDGFEHFVLAIHYLGHMIEEYFGDGSRWGVSITYLREEQPLGTGGALSLLAPHPSTPLLVTNGDVLADIRYGEVLDFHLRHTAAATMAVRSHEWQHPFGVVETQGVDIVSFKEKPVYRSHVNAGIYIIEPHALTLLNEGEHCDMPTLFERLQSGSERIIVYPMHEPWLDVGRPADLEQARITHA
jgi:dTDP-glucose pyrophosphorylase